MQFVRWIGVLLGLLVIGAKFEKGPVIEELGPVARTPAPTPKHADRKRLISVITVQNAADGESAISFEATDVADEGGGKMRTLVQQTYSLTQEEKKGQALRAKIVNQVRALEEVMLQYVEVVGPPKERSPLDQLPGGSRPGKGGGSRSR